MIGKAIAAYIGNKIDRRDGEGGTLGALAGVLTWNAARKIVPAAIIVGGALVAGNYLKKRIGEPA